MMDEIPPTPEPGRPIRLPDDRADAEALGTALHGIGAAWSRHPQALKAARESVWYIWEQPRLPRPLVASKYPMSYPWSPAARAIRSGATGRPAGGWALLFEHLRPQRPLLVDLLSQPARIDPDVLADRLREHLAAAVITRDDDARLNLAGFAGRMPDGDDGTDVWARYRAVGFDLAEFKPLVG